MSRTAIHGRFAGPDQPGGLHGTGSVQMQQAPGCPQVCQATRTQRLVAVTTPHLVKGVSAPMIRTAMSAPYVSVAAEVWVATALLHREQPHRSAFSVAEIVDRARREALVPSLRPGVNAYASGHAVANKRPSPNT